MLTQQAEEWHLPHPRDSQLVKSYITSISHQEWKPCYCIPWHMVHFIPYAQWRESYAIVDERPPRELCKCWHVQYLADKWQPKSPQTSICHDTTNFNLSSMLQFMLSKFFSAVGETVNKSNVTILLVIASYICGISRNCTSIQGP